MGENINITANNNNIKKDNDVKKIITMIVLICALMIGTTGATYAYFALTATNNNAVTGIAATANLILNVSEEELGGTASNASQTGRMVPQLYAGLGTAMSETYKCVDTNGNTVCKVYTVTVKNNSTAAVKLSGTIQFSGNGSMPNLRMARTTNTTTKGNYEVLDIANGSATWDLIATDGTTCVISTAGSCNSDSYAAGETKTYYFVVWINAATDSNGNEISQTDSGTWSATITFQGENGKGVTSTITS